MIDMITSKLAMMVAAIIILSTVLSVYTVQREHGKDLELMSIAETISRAVDDLNTIQGDTILNVTFDRGSEGRFIEPLVDGNNYNIIITCYEVIVLQGDRRHERDFMAPIHLWRPHSNSFTSFEIEDTDLEHDEFSFMSGTDFTMERMGVLVGEELGFLTFVYF